MDLTPPRAFTLSTASVHCPVGFAPRQPARRIGRGPLGGSTPRQHATVEYRRGNAGSGQFYEELPDNL